MDGDAVSSGDVGLESHGYDMGGEACTAQEVNRPDGLCFFKAFGEEYGYCVVNKGGGSKRGS